MRRIHPLASMVTEIGKLGLVLRGLYAQTSPSEGPEWVAATLPAVRDYLADPELPDGVAEMPGLTPAEIALALIVGARQAAADAHTIERAAAQIARDHGVTVRQLAAAAGISERAANDRYRKLTTSGTPPRYESPTSPGAASTEQC